MERISGFIDVKMNMEEAVKINALIERDKAKALDVEEWEFEGEPRKTYRCPVCRRTHYSNSGEFCEKCGQRLDIENVAF